MEMDRAKLVAMEPPRGDGAATRRTNLLKPAETLLETLWNPT